MLWKCVSPQKDCSKKELKHSHTATVAQGHQIPHAPHPGVRHGQWQVLPQPSPPVPCCTQWLWASLHRGQQREQAGKGLRGGRGDAAPCLATSDPLHLAEEVGNTRTSLVCLNQCASLLFPPSALTCTELLRSPSQG